jgi:hypothetical protein
MNEQKQAPLAPDDKKHDHSTRLMFLVMAVLVLILLWKTDANILSHILRVLGL